MQDVLQNLDSIKRDRIINSAIDEFSANSFKKASTNNIVKTAGISKGLLFHYFGNKRGLYDYITGFVITKLFDEIDQRINWENTDIFDRIQQIALAKIQLTSIYPKLFNFALNLFTEGDGPKTMDEAFELYEKYGVNIQELFNKVYSHNIDFSNFKNPDEIGMNLDIIRWTIEKFAEEKIIVLESLDNLDTAMHKITDEMNVYINTLKKAFYT